MRIVLAGLLGAVAMFVWTAIAHMATPLAYSGVSEMKNEKLVLDAFKQGIGTADGLYFFPWTNPKDPNAMKKSYEMMKTEPNGILVYHAPGAHYSMGPLMVKEFTKELVQSLIAAFLLSLTVLTGYLARTGFVAAIGVFAALGADTSYWVWYGFPFDYTLAQIVMGLGQAIVAGLVIAALLKPKHA